MPCKHPTLTCISLHNRVVTSDLQAHSTLVTAAKLLQNNYVKIRQDLRQQANETRAAAAIPITVRQHATACPDNEAATSESVMLDGAHTVPTIPNSQADVIMPDLPPPLDNPDDMIIKPTGNVSEVIADSKELKQKIKLMTWPLKELQ